MKQLIKSALVFSLLLFPVSAYPACVSSGEKTWNTTPDYASVAHCVSQATYDDTINVAAGTGAQTWTNQLAITRGIKIIGPGKDKLTITSAFSGYLFKYTPDAITRTNGNKFRLSGFSFAMDGHPVINFINSSNDPATIIMDNNIFDGLAADPSLRVDGLFFGVIHSNTFTASSASGLCHFDIYGRDSADDWNYLTYSYGSSATLFFEDNTLTGGDTFYTLGHGGRAVMRYNRYIVTKSLYPLLDMHGNQPSCVYAPIALEVYGNFVSAGTFNIMPFFDHRGGKALVFNNLIETTGTVTARAREEFDDGISPPALSPISGQPQHVSDSYYWNNRKYDTLLLFIMAQNTCDVTFPTGAIMCPTDTDTGIEENRDFFNHNTSYNGTTKRGIYCGASLPAGCTPGDGAWIPSDINKTPCDSIPGANAGTNATSPALGTLYKCNTNGHWEVYYSPYPYPHPLRNEDAQDPPQSFNLNITVSGNGTVTSGQHGISCNSDCSVSLEEGTSVTLTATPHNGYTFAGWSDDCSGTGACSVQLTADITVGAGFNEVSGGQTPPIAAGGGGGGCFIATAAYGSYLDPHVMVLRKFRDDILLASSSGRLFVEFYLANFPAIAEKISESEKLRLAVRIALTPVVYTLAYPVPAGIIFVAGVLALPASFAAKKRRSAKLHPGSEKIT